MKVEGQATFLTAPDRVIHAWVHGPAHGRVRGAVIFANGSAGDLEPTLRETTESLAQAPQSQGSPFSYTMYGRPTGCNGEHTFECWRPAATVALSRWADRRGIERSIAAQPVASEFKDITSGEGP